MVNGTQQTSLEVAESPNTGDFLAVNPCFDSLFYSILICIVAHPYLIPFLPSYYSYLISSSIFIIYSIYNFFQYILTI